MTDARVDRLGDVVCRAALELRRGERLLLLGTEAAAAPAVAITRCAARLGVVVRPWLTPTWLDEGLAPDPLLGAAVAVVDAVAALDVAVPAEARRGCAVAVADDGRAQDAGLSLDRYADALARAALLDDPDPVEAWLGFRRRAERLRAACAEAGELRLVGTAPDVVLHGARVSVATGRTAVPDGLLVASTGDVRVELGLNPGVDGATSIAALAPLAHGALRILRDGAGPEHAVVHELRLDGAPSPLFAGTARV